MKIVRLNMTLKTEMFLQSCYANSKLYNESTSKRYITQKDAGTHAHTDTHLRTHMIIKLRPQRNANQVEIFRTH